MEHIVVYSNYGNIIMSSFWHGPTSVILGTSFTRLRCVFPVLLAAEGLPRRWMVVEVALFLFLGLI